MTRQNKIADVVLSTVVRCYKDLDSLGNSSISDYGIIDKTLSYTELLTLVDNKITSLQTK